MSDTQLYKVRRIIPFYAPSDYRKHLLETTRREVGNRIFDILWANRLPSVVDVDERIYTDYANTPHLNYGHPDEVLELEISITPVQHRHVTMASMNYLDMPKLEEGFFKKVKRWIKNIKKKVNH